MSKKTAREILSYTNKSIEEVEKEIKRAYKTALDKIRIELLKLNEKGSLTDSEMFRYGRFENLKKLIETELKDVSKSVFKRIRNAQNKSYINAYEKIFTDAGLKPPKLNIDFIKKAVENPLYNANFKDSLLDNTRKNAVKISSIVTNSLIQGASIADISKEIKDAMNSTAWKALQIARTETLRVLSQSQVEGTDKIVEKLGKERVRKVWLYSYHVKDSRTTHEGMDGKEADEDGFFRFIGQNGYEVQMQAPRMSGDAAEDINCRCSYYNEIKEE